MMHTINHRRSNIIILWILGGFVFFVMGFSELVLWVLIIPLLYILSLNIMKACKSGGIVWQITLFAYMLLSLIGMILIINYRTLYGLSFGPYGDDSFYFQQIYNLSNGLTVEKQPALYEYFMVPWFKLASIFNNNPTNLDLLPVNWGIGAIVVALAVAIARRVSNNIEFPALLCIISLVGNSIFSDSVVNLYRDGFMLMLYLYAILFALNKKIKFGLLFSIACGLTRVANGIISIISIILIYINNTEKNLHAGQLRTIVITSVLIGIFTISAFFPIASLVDKRSIGHITNHDSMLEIIADRSEIFMSANVNEEASTVQKVFSFGPLGYIFTPAVNLFAPFRLIDLFQHIEVHIENYRYFTVYGLYPRAIWIWITVFLWIVIGPDIVNGIYHSMKGSLTQRTLFYIFIITLIGVSFISFQPRHRLAFIVFFPTFIGISKEFPSSIFVKNVLRIGFIIGIIILNYNRFF